MKISKIKDYSEFKRALDCLEFTSGFISTKLVSTVLQEFRKNKIRLSIDSIKQVIHVNNPIDLYNFSRKLISDFGNDSKILKDLNWTSNKSNLENIKDIKKNSSMITNLTVLFYFKTEITIEK